MCEIDIDKLNIEKLTSFSTFYSCDKKYINRCFNINLCTNEITGTIVKKGSTFDWFDIVGDTSAKEGYKIADIYLGGKVKKGYGGGVCQVATTLYNCALNLNLEIIERHAHGLPVTYVDYKAGKDASVGNIGGYNLIFKNTLDYDILIKAYTKENERNKKGEITVEFYRINE